MVANEREIRILLGSGLVSPSLDSLGLYVVEWMMDEKHFRQTITLRDFFAGMALSRLAKKIDGHSGS